MNNRYLISLSGGGYRAALFNAGVLRTLHEADILRPNLEPDRLHVLVNAVSGGAIAAEIWNRFLRSEEYDQDKDSFAPEEALIALVEGSPRFLGKFNWHWRGAVIRAQEAWFRHLHAWWRNLELREKPLKLDKNFAKYVSPGDAQCYPVFIFQSLNYNDGHIIAFHEGRYFEADRDFYERGIPKDVRVENLPAPHGIVSATAFPGFFPKVSLPELQLIDAGLVDNQALYNFHPLLKKNAKRVLGPGDTWFLSNAGREMSVVRDGERLRFSDKVFRLTGDLAQPKMNELIMDIVESGLGCHVCGVHIAVSHLDEQLWVKGNTIQEAKHSAGFPTTLSYIGRADALAILSHGAQCAANAIHVPAKRLGALKNRLIDMDATIRR
ncbi:MAG: patatin-like phospholipase family protein [Proteobacteria bacterium]|nr:patatin-like phospholipase family protein [Pseudomonadota bacterium]